MTTQRLSIIDWDDTLFPTNWIHDVHLNLKNPSEDTVQMFSYLDQLIVNLIIGLQQESQVRIISNGSESWIKTCLNVLPKVKQLIQLGVFDIMSARDICSDMYAHGKEWKEWTFKLCVTETFNGIEQYDYQHIISIGDSDDEHSALLKLDEYHPDGTVQKRILKSVRLKPKPTLNELVNQLVKLEGQIFDILFYIENQVYKIN